MQIPVSLKDGSYTITIEPGALNKVGEYLDLDRKVLIVSNPGILDKYIQPVIDQAKDPIVAEVPQGEEAKSFKELERLLRIMLKEDFFRTDCVVAVGGGVVGDLAGFTASCYMRGIDFYNIPTTLLSQIDSSSGGKTAINLDHVKNVVGAFHWPSHILVDPQVLESLPMRQFNNGLAEAIKMSLTFDEDYFEFIESGGYKEDITRLIRQTICIKRDIIEQDAKEYNLRRILNYGHTVGHALESITDLLHGEAVAVGMTYFSEDPVLERLIPLLKKTPLPYYTDVTPKKMMEKIVHDKKHSGSGITTVHVPEIGSYEFKDYSEPELLEFLEKKHEYLRKYYID